jgi:hypothetical protein
VRLNWLGGEKPFNPNFIQQKPLNSRKNSKRFPNNKNEAIAATAVRLSQIGTVMIFSARANSINGFAESVLLAMGKSQSDFDWDKSAWDKFESICSEEIASDDIILRAARKGVICHSNRLSTLVRNAIERLMRSRPPIIIIASSTLGQGVNIGISSVIIATPYVSDEIISSRDFWNICGRAGRAYSDIDGKILYAIDSTEGIWKTEKNANIARNYFKAVYEPVESGVLGVLRMIKKTADKAGVSFELLIEAISNDFSEPSAFDADRELIQYIFELIDDELLAMHEDYTDFLDGIEWVDTVFRESLALIQAKETERQQLLEILKTRMAALRLRVPQKAERQAIIATGIPFTVSIALLNDEEIFRNIAMMAMFDDNIRPHIDNSLEVVKRIEEWVWENANSLVDDSAKKARENLSAEDIDMLRKKWIVGTDFAIISRYFKKADVIIKKFYEFTLPWIINAISRLFDPETDEDIQKFYSRLALFAELGVPSETAANIYLSGINSRRTAVELSGLDCLRNVPILEMKHSLIALADNTESVSDSAKVWLVGLSNQYKVKDRQQVSIKPFRLDCDAPSRLLARCVNDESYLLSADGYFQIKVGGEIGMELKAIANRLDAYFERQDDGTYNLCMYNP